LTRYFLTAVGSVLAFDPFGGTRTKSPAGAPKRGCGHESAEAEWPERARVLRDNAAGQPP